VPGVGPVSIKTVAARARTSPSTVSRVLNGLGDACRISQATQDRIRAAAEELGFTPNSVAKSLRLGATGLIGLIVPDISNPFFATIARAVSIEAQRRGRSILLYDTRDDLTLEQAGLTAMLNGHVDGLIVVPVGQECEHLRRFETARTPVVLVDRWFTDLALPSVASDHRAGARDTVAHLLARGHRRIACITGLAGTASNDLRLQGVRDALATHGLELDPRLVAGGGFGREDGHRAIRQLLAGGTEFTAVFAFGNLLGIGALAGLLEAGRGVPDDVSLVSFDEEPSSAVLAVPMSTVQQDEAEIGRLAVDLVCRRIEQPDAEPPASVVVPTRLVPRASIATRHDAMLGAAR
jgi:LacI family transcriptional regulator